MLPLIKVGVLVLRQVSKPVANSIVVGRAQRGAVRGEKAARVH
jgi:hypothetical protein